MYHYTESGLQNVWLRNGYRETRTPYGKGVSIADADALDVAIGAHVVQHKPRLGGSEFRFLRKHLGLSQRALAELWGYDEQSVAIWEKRGRVPIIADRFIRLLWIEHTGGNPKIRKLVETLNAADEQDDSRLLFEQHRKHWKAASA